MFVQLEMCFAWSGVSIFHEKLFYVSIHGYAAGSLSVLLIIIPSTVYSCKIPPLPVGCYLVVLIQDLEEM